MACRCGQLNGRENNERENYGRECERNFEERCFEERGGCRGNRCQEAIRRVERDTRELAREINEVEKKACQLRRDVENLNRACTRWENPEWDGDCGNQRPCGCQRPCRCGR